MAPGVAPGTSAGCHPVPFLGVTPYRSRGGATSCLESRRVASALGGGRGQRGGEVRNDKRLRALELDGERGELVVSFFSEVWCTAFDFL